MCVRNPNLCIPPQRVPLLGTTSHISNVCKNKKFIEARLSCSYQYNDKMRLNTARECYLISEYIKNNLEHFTLPLFVLHSVDDTVTDPYKTIEFYKQHSNEKKKIYLTHDANHILTLGNDDDDKRPMDILNKMVEFIDSLV